MNTLHFMGMRGHVDNVRCRVYGGQSDTKDEAKRLAFLRACASSGAVDCPAYDGWVSALQSRGWLPETPALEPNPDGPGQIGRWKLTDEGRKELARIEGATR